ncbi:MAG TPA: NUDIX hydrolase [Flavipsychrobacter sp.]|nr:NUDIX hydrolase [Flavipsychrobacter sp.]
MQPTRFNIRVYGIWLHEGKVLVNEELIKGRLITKFPGGGLELGEGTIDCLVREWKEELGLDIEVLEHFYTTDFFQQSAFDNSQVISIYYFIKANEVPQEIINYVENERTFWINLREISAYTFQLPIDKKVGSLLQTLSAERKI